MDDAASREYRRRADEVEKLAETAISEDHRRQILEIAAKWREMANERDEFWSRRNGASCKELLGAANIPLNFRQIR